MSHKREESGEVDFYDLALALSLLRPRSADDVNAARRGMQLLERIVAKGRRTGQAVITVATELDA